MPAIPIEQSNHRRGDLQQIRRNQQGRGLGAPGMGWGAWVYVDLHQPDAFWKFVLFTLAAQPASPVLHDAHPVVGNVQRTDCCDGKDTVIPDATHKGRLGQHDLMEERKLGRAAIEDIEASRCEDVGQDVTCAS